MRKLRLNYPCQHTFRIQHYDQDPPRAPNDVVTIGLITVSRSFDTNRKEFFSSLSAEVSNNDLLVFAAEVKILAVVALPDLEGVVEPQFNACPVGGYRLRETAKYTTGC